MGLFWDVFDLHTGHGAIMAPEHAFHKLPCYVTLTPASRRANRNRVTVPRITRTGTVRTAQGCRHGKASRSGRPLGSKWSIVNGRPLATAQHRPDQRPLHLGRRAPCCCVLLSDRRSDVLKVHVGPKSQITQAAILDRVGQPVETLRRACQRVGALGMDKDRIAGLQSVGQPINGASPRVSAVSQVGPATM